MFETPGPHIFALPPGADFPALLVQGLRSRLAGQPPEAMARTVLYVNTQRMRRRIIDLFVAGGAGFLPQIRLVTDLGSGMANGGIPAAVSPLRRRLELTQLVAALLDAQPELAPRTALYDLADSLAALMDEMQGEGVSPATVTALDVSDHSAHWQRTQKFLAIVAPYFNGSAAPDIETRQRLVVEALARDWQEKPPQNPVILAGSTGSRGTTAQLMQAVARLPQGALVLPGFDFDLPHSVWNDLADAMTAEDHPQYRFRRLMERLHLDPGDIRPWVKTQAPSPARNRLISLSLRPAPVTDQWLTEGKFLTGLAEATAAMTLIEAPSARAEALAVALILRQAAQTGRIAALVTPDRGLTRQVTAALDRWGILPDDSAGQPLALSAPGRLLRHVAGAIGRQISTESLLTLLKHPLTATGADRGTHLRLTRDLELKLRKYGPPFPSGEMLTTWAVARNDPAALPWAAWLAHCIEGIEDISIRTLTDHVTRHLALAEMLACGADGAGTGMLWQRKAGEAALAAVLALQKEAMHGGSLNIFDYRNLFEAVLSKGEVREDVQTHPRIMIWGTLEARVQGADLVILGGLNDGTWPQLPPPDPWLNRQMRQKAALLLPERRIGLSAHDFQQAIAAPEVILTRANRDADAETVPSRWLNRLTNLLGGLPGQGGPEAMEAMRKRGQIWLNMAEALERPEAATPAAHRPAPRPPVIHRPEKLAVTGIKTLIRDPYAIYARYILRLKKLDPLRQTPDARLRGSLLHLILERFVRERPTETRAEARHRLLSIAEDIMAAEAPWPAARALWRARLERATDFFLDIDTADNGTPIVLENEGRIALAPLPFTLTARPDRIDALPDGRLHILDYKTGTPPTKPQQKHFDKQLLLEAAMAERGAFPDTGPCEVAKASYIGLGSTPKIEQPEISEAILGQVWEDLHRLIGKYLDPTTGYASRRAVFEDRFPGDYDHLARYGEWEMSDTPKSEDVGDAQ
ncbi:MAG: double-strand break repair protein AddB [Paracoccaceae bacterium]|nr:double-strand break repair protein AddB [Paracoccaceae bacterium]